ncbi:MAG TPA: hypothetical protein VGC41_01315 [Kofleriaceae bacterium]
MTNDTTKLSQHTTWLFAIGSIAAGIGASYALSGLGSKVTAAVYFAIVAVGGFLSTYLTRAKTGGAILSFLVGAIVAAGSYYFLVKGVVASTTTAMGDLSSSGQAHAQASQAGSQMGQTFGIFVAVIVFLETIVAGIGGAVAGSKSRGAGGLAALGAMAKSAR